jgi:hypothetical protein
VGRLASGLIGPKAEKNPFGIKIGFLNLPRLCKFVQGDLRGIWIQGLFLNSSRILKDFFKEICHAMNAILNQIKLRKSFLRLNFSKNAN